MKSLDFIKLREAPATTITSTTSANVPGNPQSHPNYQTYYQQELAKNNRGATATGQQIAATMAANRVQKELAQAKSGEQLSVNGAPPVQVGGGQPAAPVAAPAAAPGPFSVAQMGIAARAQGAGNEPPSASATPAPAPTAAPAPAATTPVAPAKQQFSKAITDLAAANNIADPNRIQVGQQIKLPSGQTYTVAKGDTLWGITQGKFKGTAPAATPAPATPPAAAPAATTAASNPAYGTQADPRQGRSYGQATTVATANDPRARGYQTNYPGQPNQFSGVTPMRNVATSADATVPTDLVQQKPAGGRTTLGAQSKNTSTIKSSQDKPRTNMVMEYAAMSAVEKMQHLRSIVMEAPPNPNVPASGQSRQATNWQAQRAQQLRNLPTSTVTTPSGATSTTVTGTGAPSGPSRFNQSSGGRAFTPRAGLGLTGQSPVTPQQVTQIFNKQRALQMVLSGIGEVAQLILRPTMQIARGAATGIGTAGGIAAGIGGAALIGGLVYADYKQDWRVMKRFFDLAKSGLGILGDITGFTKDTAPSPDSGSPGTPTPLPQAGSEQTNAKVKELIQDLEAIKQFYQNEETWRQNMADPKQKAKLQRFLVCVIRGLQANGAKVDELVAGFKSNDPDAFYAAKGIDAEFTKNIACKYLPSGAVEGQ